MEFKRQVVEELLSGESGAAQICRKYNICVSLLYHWKDIYSQSKFNNEPAEVDALKNRIEKPEKLAGKFTLENKVLKGHCRTASAVQMVNQEKSSLSPNFPDFICPIMVMQYNLFR